MVDAQVFLIFRFTNQQSLWVGQECSVNEAQADVIPVNADLAYPRADWSSALLIIIAKTPAVLAFGCLRGNARHNVPDLQHDISQVRRYIL